MAQKPKANCDEANAAMLPPINLIFLLKGSLSVLVERAPQQITITQREVKNYFRGSCLFFCLLLFH